MPSTALSAPLSHSIPSLPSLPSLFKRSTSVSYPPSTRVEHSSSYHCKYRCCASTSRESEHMNSTHWYGYGVDQPTEYQEIEGGGVVMIRENGTLFVANCGSGIAVTEYVYQGAGVRRKVGLGMLVLALGVGLAVV